MKKSKEIAQSLEKRANCRACFYSIVVTECFMDEKSPGKMQCGPSQLVCKYDNARQFWLTDDGVMCCGFRRL